MAKKIRMREETRALCEKIKNRDYKVDLDISS